MSIQFKFIIDLTIDHEQNGINQSINRSDSIFNAQYFCFESLVKHAWCMFHVLSTVSRNVSWNARLFLFAHRRIIVYRIERFVIRTLYIKRKFLVRPKGGGVRDRGYATGRQAGRQSEGAVRLLYPRRPVGGSAPGANCCDDFPTSSCPPPRSPPSPSLCSPLFPQGVAFNRPGCLPTFFLAAFR